MTESRSGSPHRGSGNGPTLTLAQVAELTGGTVVGDPDRRVGDLLPLEQAGPGELGFLSDRRYLRFLEGSLAEALLVARGLAELIPPETSAVVVGDPHHALAVLVDRFHPLPSSLPGIHPTAVFGRGVRLGSHVTVGPYVVVGDDVVLGDRVVLSPHVVVGDGSQIGDGSVLHPHVVLYAGSRIGREVILHAGVRVGVDGFGYVFHEGQHRKVRQVGGCAVEDRVEIGANSCIDRGSIGRTTVGEGSKLDNLVHVGHNVRIGPLALLVAQVGVAGSSRVGKGAVLGGQVGVSGHLEIGEGARVGAQAGVIGDVPPGETVSGYPARPHRSYLQAMATLFRLPGLLRDRDHRIAGVEERLGDRDQRIAGVEERLRDRDERIAALEERLRRLEGG